jgi:hypothetical protein
VRNRCLSCPEFAVGRDSVYFGCRSLGSANPFRALELPFLRVDVWRFVSVAASEIGKASGTFNMLRYLGGVFGIAILVAVFAETGNFGTAQAFTEGFALATISAGLSFVGAIAGLGLPVRRVVAHADAGAPGEQRKTQSGIAMNRC